MLCETLDLAVAQIPKAGVTSINGWLRRAGRAVPNQAALTASRRVAFIRNPIDRLKSCYSMMHWQEQQGEPHWSGAPTDSWGAFVDHVLLNENAHWNPQVSIVDGAPNIYHRFENIETHYRQYFDAPLPHLNRSERLPAFKYREDELTALYMDDLSLWAGIN